jgi:uncharacterized integral membrane protein
MTGPYKRRKSANWIRTLWVYRWLVLVAVLLGTLLWFILNNGQQVTVHFPFGLGQPTASIGTIILASAAAGALAAVLGTVLVLTLHRYRNPAARQDAPVQDLPDDRPPSDYASKTPEGFSDAPGSAR